jgi:hypothetical protein
VISWLLESVEEIYWSVEGSNTEMQCKLSYTGTGIDLLRWIVAAIVAAPSGQRLHSSAAMRKWKRVPLRKQVNAFDSRRLLNGQKAP